MVSVQAATPTFRVVSRSVILRLLIALPDMGEGRIARILEGVAPILGPITTSDRDEENTPPNAQGTSQAVDHRVDIARWIGHWNRVEGSLETLLRGGEEQIRRWTSLAGRMLASSMLATLVSQGKSLWGEIGNAIGKGLVAPVPRDLGRTDGEAATSINWETLDHRVDMAQWIGHWNRVEGSLETLLRGGEEQIRRWTSLAGRMLASSMLATLVSKGKSLRGEIGNAIGKGLIAPVPRDLGCADGGEATSINWETLAEVLPPIISAATSTAAPGSFTALEYYLRRQRRIALLKMGAIITTTLYTLWQPYRLAKAPEGERGPITERAYFGLGLGAVGGLIGFSLGGPIGAFIGAAIGILLGELLVQLKQGTLFKITPEQLDEVARSAARWVGRFIGWLIKGIVMLFGYGVGLQIRLNHPEEKMKIYKTIGRLLEEVLIGIGEGLEGTMSALGETFLYGLGPTLSNKLTEWVNGLVESVRSIMLPADNPLQESVMSEVGDFFGRFGQLLGGEIGRFFGELLGRFLGGKLFKKFLEPLVPAIEKIITRELVQDLTRRFPVLGAVLDKIPLESALLPVLPTQADLRMETDTSGSLGASVPLWVGSEMGTPWQRLLESNSGPTLNSVLTSPSPGDLRVSTSHLSPSTVLSHPSPGQNTAPRQAVTVSIGSLAGTLVVRDEADTEKIAGLLAEKLRAALANVGQYSLGEVTA